MNLDIGESPLRVNYYLRLPNVGERLSPEVVSAVSGSPAVYYRGPADHLIAGGTALADAGPSSHIWGSGAMFADKAGNALPQNIYAVRGKLTYQALKTAGKLIGDVPLGDPAYLASSLLGVTKTKSPKHKIGIAPHYIDSQNPYIKELLANRDVAFLNVNWTPVRFLRELAECACVASSSLHGLILAESLGIPNVWIKAGDRIGGGSFRFDDWFSTTQDPQKQPVIINQNVTSDDLASACRLHDSALDTEALAASFPHNRMVDLARSADRKSYPVIACRDHPIPVFLISFNRGDFLQKTISDIRNLNTPTEIVVQDNGSSDGTTVDILNRLDKDGVKVYRREPISSAEELNNLDETVSHYFRNWAEPQNYVVSDCDISLDCADKDTLEVYRSLLGIFPSVDCVGPMLRISDIPQSYPLYVAVMNRHIGAFWQTEPRWVTTPQGQVAYQRTRIDTTFALHRAGEPFKRLKQALRVYHPYEARHLDWYVGNEISAYAESSHPNVANWGNKTKLESASKVADLKYDWYFVVDGESEPGIRRVQLHPPPTR